MIDLSKVEKEYKKVKKKWYSLKAVSCNVYCSEVNSERCHIKYNEIVNPISYWKKHVTRFQIIIDFKRL
jgi:hypothetical protein